MTYMVSVGVVCVSSGVYDIWGIIWDSMTYMVSAELYVYPMGLYDI